MTIAAVGYEASRVVAVRVNGMRRTIGALFSFGIDNADKMHICDFRALFLSDIHTILFFLVPIGGHAPPRLPLNRFWSIHYEGSNLSWSQ